MSEASKDLFCTLQDDVEKAETTNKELIDYIERLQTAQQDYKGKDISQVKGLQKATCHQRL